MLFLLLVGAHVLMAWLCGQYPRAILGLAVAAGLLFGFLFVMMGLSSGSGSTRGTMGNGAYGQAWAAIMLIYIGGWLGALGIAWANPAVAFAWPTTFFSLASLGISALVAFVLYSAWG